MSAFAVTLPVIETPDDTLPELWDSDDERWTPVTFAPTPETVDADIPENVDPATEGSVRIDSSDEEEEEPTPDPNAMTELERDNLYAKLHPAEMSALNGKRYYVPLYTALHQTQRWCGNPGCHRPVSREAKCPLCRTLFCGPACQAYIHNGDPKRPRPEGIPPSWCGYMDQTEAISGHLAKLFLISENPDTDNYFAEYRLIQQLEEWLMFALALGKDYQTLSTLSKEALLHVFHDTPAYKFVDAAGMDMFEHGVPPPVDQGKKTVVFQCGRENCIPDLAGLIGFLCLGLDLICNNGSRAAMFMTAPAMVHASRSRGPFADTLFVGVSQSPDAVRPEFLTGETLASPLSIFKADQATGWPACYYCITLVPLGDMDNVTRRAMQFSVGLYVTPKDAIVIGSAGMEETVGDSKRMLGYGILSLLRAHAAPKANVYVNPKAAGAQAHLDLSAAERWLKRLNDLTVPDGTAGHRESVIRETLAIGSKVKYPMPFPRYRLVTCRIIMNIV